jgi:ankyrin repeat protein
MSVKNEKLLEASMQSDLLTIESLVSKGADIHYQDDMALRNACDAGNLEIVKYFVEQGANIHAANDDALCGACGYGHLDIVVFLIEKGANIDSADGVPLMWAISHGHIDVVKYLLGKGVDLTKQKDKILYHAEKYAKKTKNNHILKYLQPIMNMKECTNDSAKKISSKKKTKTT